MTGFLAVTVPGAYTLHVPDPPPPTGLPRDTVHNYDVEYLPGAAGDGVTTWPDYSDSPDALFATAAAIANDPAVGRYVTLPPGASLQGSVKRLVPRTVVALLRTSLLGVYVGSICGFRIRRASGGPYQLVSPNPPSGGGAKTLTAGGAAANTSGWALLVVSLAADGSALLNVGGTDVTAAAGAFDVGTSNFTTPSLSVDAGQTSGLDVAALFEMPGTITSAELAAMRVVQKARRVGAFT